MAKKLKPTANAKLRNRVLDRRKILGSELVANSRNWRTHPKAQAEALRGILEEIGQVGELYAYHSERAGGKLVLIDGHLRSEEFADQEWDVAITDLSDEEADKLLLAYDPLAAMAEANKENLEALIRDVQIKSEGLAGMLGKLAEQNAIIAKNQEPDQEPEPDIPEQFCVLIECETEDQQKEILQRMTNEGLQCRALIS